MTSQSMRVSLHLNSYAERTSDIGPSLRDVAPHADQAGISAIALMDHFLHPGPESEASPVLEGYTTLGYLAAVTKYTDLMLLVSGVTHRHPVLLAKAVSTLDVLSGGRARLGIGAGWFEAENRSYGMAFPPTRERFTMLEETLQIMRQLWSSNDVGFAGEHFQLDTTMLSPRPMRSPHPPIVVGGNGRNQTLRLAARYADGCNILAGPSMGGIAEANSLVSRLRGHCLAIGRDPLEITVSILYTAPVPMGKIGAAQFVREMREYASLGVDEVFVMPLDQPNIIRFVDELGESILPAVQEATQGITSR